MQESASNQKKIVLLGSGMMAEAIVDYLLRRKENHIVIASNILQDSQAIASKRQRCSALMIDAKNIEQLKSIIKDSDVVISYIPASLHIFVAQACLEMSKHLVTASYISPEMALLDDKVKKKGLIFLNEIGLDPGIDHLSTMKVVDECTEQGDKIIEYESWCGGLPSPEFCDNPLGYKFSWSPIGALSALNNDAVFLLNGVQKRIQGKDLLYNAEDKDINQALSLEGYPNRDSMRYKNLYGLKDCTKVIRGTLRYRGFSQIMNVVKELGYYKQDKLPNDISWLNYIKNQLKKESHDAKGYYSTIFHRLGIEKDIKDLSTRLLNRDTELITRGVKILEALLFLGLFNDKQMINKNQTIFENFANLMQQKLILKKDETDLVVMQHIFRIRKKNTTKIYTRKSTLIAIGQKHGFTAMALTVSTPSAIAAQLILDGKINETGVIIPIKKTIYEPILKELDQNGIRCIENISDAQGLPEIKPSL